MADDVTPESSAPAETPVETTAPVTTETEVSSAPDTFSREYVEDLRKESAGYRTRAKSFEDTFEGLEDADKDYFLNLVKTYKENPLDAASQMDQVAKAILEAQRENEVDPHNAEPITEERVLQIIADKEAKADEEAKAEEVKHAAEALGYSVDTWQYNALLAVALSDPEADLNKAHETLTAWRKEAVADYVTDKAKDASSLPTAPAAGGAPSGEREVKTMSDAKKALQERLSAQQISN